MWIPMVIEFITPLVNELKTIFPVVDYAYTYIPTYTMGQIGFILASKDPVSKPFSISHIDARLYLLTIAYTDLVVYSDSRNEF